MTSVDTTIPTRQIAFDYDRTVVAFHGTRRSTAEKLVAGVPFGQSENDDDWLGHGIYFWEYAPQQAWWWAERRYGKDDAVVVGSLVRLGRCIDLLDPSNAELLVAAHDGLEQALKSVGQSFKKNANTHKYLDCAVFNYLFCKTRTVKHRSRERPCGVRSTQSGQGASSPVGPERRVSRRAHSALGSRTQQHSGSLAS